MTYSSKASWNILPRMELNINLIMKAIALLTLLVAAATATRGPGEWIERLAKNRERFQETADTKESSFETPFVGQSIFPVRGKSGYVGVTDDPVKNQMFYWFFESQSDPKKDPILIWLTGGPGCSSEFGLAFEVGPWLVLKDPNTGTISISPNQFSWNTKANLLFIDQPVGVGYSLGDPSKYPTN